MAGHCAHRFVISAACAGAALSAVQILVPGGWWLDSRFGVLSTGAALAALTMVMTTVGSSASRDQWCLVCSIWLGATMGLTFRLIAIGPGTIFPIVIVVGTPILVGATAVGWACGCVLREWRRGRLRHLRKIGPGATAPRAREHDPSR